MRNLEQFDAEFMADGGGGGAIPEEATLAERIASELPDACAVRADGKLVAQSEYYIGGQIVVNPAGVALHSLKGLRQD